LAVALLAVAGGLGYWASRDAQSGPEQASPEHAEQDAQADERLAQEERGNRRTTPRAYFEAGELVIEGPAVDMMIYGIGAGKLSVPSDASKDVVWYWKSAVKPVPGNFELATLRQPLAAPPTGLAYLELSWSEKDGDAVKRIPVEFPAP
jgi:hypothetical protein